MTLIEQLKELNEAPIKFNSIDPDDIFSVFELLPEIVEILEQQEKLLEEAQHLISCASKEFLKQASERGVVYDTDIVKLDLLNRWLQQFEMKTK